MTPAGKRRERLQAQDAPERDVAMAPLVAQGDQAAVTALSDALLRSHWPVSDELADALVRIGTDAARQGLLRALKGRRHHIRSAAVKALVRLGGDGVGAAIAALANDPSYEVRQDVQAALAAFDSSKAQPRE